MRIYLPKEKTLNGKKHSQHDKYFPEASLPNETLFSGDWRHRRAAHKIILKYVCFARVFVLLF
jgi:hypothetical protein